MKERQPMSEIDPKLLEMAEVFHMPRKARMKYIILPVKAPGLAKLMNRKKRNTTVLHNDHMQEGRADDN